MTLDPKPRQRRRALLYKRVKELRAEGLTLREVAARLGYSNGYASALWAQLQKEHGDPVVRWSHRGPPHRDKYSHITYEQLVAFIDAKVLAKDAAAQLGLTPGELSCLWRRRQPAGQRQRWVSGAPQQRSAEAAARADEIIQRRNAGESQQAVGDHFGITRERVRQIEVKRRAKLGMTPAPPPAVRRRRAAARQALLALTPEEVLARLDLFHTNREAVLQQLALEYDVHVSDVLSRVLAFKLRATSHPRPTSQGYRFLLALRDGAHRLATINADRSILDDAQHQSPTDYLGPLAGRLREHGLVRRIKYGTYMLTPEGREHIRAVEAWLKIHNEEA